jgi:hypothetical protein
VGEREIDTPHLNGFLDNYYTVNIVSYLIAKYEEYQFDNNNQKKLFELC